MGMSQEDLSVFIEFIEILAGIDEKDYDDV